MKIEIEIEEFTAEQARVMALGTYLGPVTKRIMEQIALVLEASAPKKEEPKEAIPHIHPHGISDCQFCLPTLTVNWKIYDNPGWTPPEKEDLSKLIPTGWYSVHTKGKVIPFAPKEDRFYKLLDLRNELISAGFTRKEANYLIQPLVTLG